VMSTRFAEDIHDAGQRLVDAGAHVKRLHCEPVSTNCPVVFT
jgi:hypothetical protein